MITLRQDYVSIKMTVHEATALRKFLGLLPFTKPSRDESLRLYLTIMSNTEYPVLYKIFKSIESHGL